MKKIILAFSAATIMVGASAQKGKVTSANLNMQSYIEGYGSSYVEKAKTDIDAAAENEESKIMGKTWFVKAKVYQAIANDSALSIKFSDAGFEALSAYKKMFEINDPKFKDVAEAKEMLKDLARVFNNNGADAYMSNNFYKAYKYYYATNDIATLLKQNNAKIVDSVYQSYLENAVLCADKTGKKEELNRVLQTLVENYPVAKSYHLLANSYLEEKNYAKADEVLNAGLAKFPSNKDLLIDKINRYLKEEKTAEATSYLEEAVKLDPKNEQILSILGLAYEKAGKEEAATKVYKSMLDANPKSFEAQYSMGSMIFNKAKTLTDQMNALGYSKAETIKFDELKAKRKLIFEEALPYLTKAQELDPKNEQVEKALKVIKSQKDQ